MKWYVKVLSNNNSFPTEHVGCTGNIDLKLGLHRLSKVRSIYKNKNNYHSDEVLTFEMSAFKLCTMANLHYQLSWKY